ncbi:MAG TPA: molybdenum cofactor biosynthesis protein MoaE [Clostridiaceae bacterium]|nr:molybdenum cofactor biosynthesis protein MoaE [Clostridiaceae bacterium]
MNNNDFFTGEKPDITQWLKEAKEQHDAEECGMYLVHNGVVRATPRAQVREGAKNQQKVQSLSFSYLPEKVLDAISETKQMPGIFFVRVWLNCGQLKVGDDMMFALIGGDIRPRVFKALEFLVGRLKDHGLIEIEKS